MIGFSFNTSFGLSGNGDGANRANIAACPIINRKAIISTVAFSQIFFPRGAKADTETEDAQGTDNGYVDNIKRDFAKRMETRMADYELGIEERKRALFAELVPAGSAVVELGIGVGPNLRYMPQNVNVVGVEPNQHMWPFCQARASEHGVSLTLRDGVAEKLPLDDASADVFVSTLTLCSVQSPAAALAEAARVLRPGGTLIFVEHVLAPRSRPFLRLWQYVFDPILRDMRDGCRFTQDTEQIIRDAVESGVFENMSVDHFDAHFDCALMGPLRPQIAGCVRRTSASVGTLSGVSAE